MKNIIILGSTGSIGRSTLNVIKRYGANPILFTANKNIKLLAEQANEFKPKYLWIADNSQKKDLKLLLNYNGIILDEPLEKILLNLDYDIAVNAIVGFAGLSSSISVLKHSKILALANKESLVVAGPYLKKLAKQYHAEIVPVDSEHSAIYEILRAYKGPVKYITLTASGGPFFQKSIENVSPSDALKHPTWNMGKKISIDSATMVNKGLELIEAMYLFDMAPDKIDIVIHPQSIIHGMVEFNDGSLHTVTSYNSMELPIAKALYNKEIYEADEPVVQSLHSLKGKKLEFFEPDFDKFKALNIAKFVAKKGGIFPIIFNAVNEELVYSFLDEKISFKQIVDGIDIIIKQTEDKEFPKDETLLLNFIKEIDLWARTEAKNIVLRFNK